MVLLPTSARSFIVRSSAMPTSARSVIVRSGARAAAALGNVADAAFVDALASEELQKRFHSSRSTCSLSAARGTAHVSALCASVVHSWVALAPLTTRAASTSTHSLAGKGRERARLSSKWSAAASRRVEGELTARTHWATRRTRWQRSATRHTSNSPEPNAPLPRRGRLPSHRNPRSTTPRRASTWRPSSRLLKGSLGGCTGASASAERPEASTAALALSTRSLGASAAAVFCSSAIPPSASVLPRGPSHASLRAAPLTEELREAASGASEAGIASLHM